MKGKLHKSMNYGWMVQDDTGFYPLYPYDLFTNSIERVEGKEVDFTLVHSWNEEEEKLIEVAIISAKITDVPKKLEISEEIIAKWNKNPNAYGVYDIIGGLEAIGTKEAFDLRDYIIDSDEYDIKDILQMVNNLKFT